MEERDGVTTTSFRVMVCESEPYTFQTCAAQQLQSSVRITHITFTPPSSDEVEAYVQHQHKAAPAATLTTDDADISSVTVARVRTLCASGQLESYAVACFPWGRTGASGGAAGAMAMAGRGGRGGKRASQAFPSAAAPAPVERVKLAGVFEVPLPRQTDICGNIDLRLDVDGSVSLEVVGPGSVTFFGEQHSALIPEWLNHRFFTVGDDDEEYENNEDDYDDDDGDVGAMYRLFS